MVVERFSPAVKGWFTTTFGEPTSAQTQGWPAISQGSHTLICAPTGSGKTLAAFLWSIDQLGAKPPPDDAKHRTRVLYISPLRALAFDIEKNLRAPLAGIELAAERIGETFYPPVVGMRTGDTASRDRQALIRRPPDILITTPESLYLMLTSSARETLRHVETVIIDEIHAMAATKRGAHLALSLERLDAICERSPQRIGLSATQRPLEEVARFLGGYSSPGSPRPVAIVDAGVRKTMEITVSVPVEDMGEMGQVIDEIRSGPAAGGPAKRSIWPSIHPRILEQVLEHRSTIIFTNTRRLAERLAARLNELAVEEGAVPDGVELVKAHHGSLAREQRVVIEDQLKRGELRALAATSSLELGIDMGAVDLVIQVESPGAVSRGLQRIGRAGHSVGEPSRGTIFPKHRADLLETAVVVPRMLAGLIESTHYLRNPLDVLAQQIVAMAAMDEWDEEEMVALVRRCACFADIGDDIWRAVLDLLAGRYPSEEFSELRPRIVWDRTLQRVRAREGAKRLAVTSGGTIPDRGLFGVFLPDGTRVGELDEEMVYESRAGETFVLGASTWRIEDITFERVIVTPAPGQPGKMPFWHGDRPGRPLELGQAIGAFVRELRSAPSETEAIKTLEAEGNLDELAARNLVRFVGEQAEATGAVPDDRTIVIERFRDEIGDWRVCILSPFGASVHAPWAMAINHVLTERFGMPVEILWSDDGIVLRLPEAAEELPLDSVLIDPDEITALVTSLVPTTSLFAARFRECAARALLLPRRRPDKRTPLWQQRQRAANLLSVASKYPTFPILLETTRECLQDVFDLPGLRSILADLRSRRIRVVSVETPKASPFAQSLVFSWIANFMYDGDAPLAERRAAALTLDGDLLRELLGAEELRELLDPVVLQDVELELQRLADGRRARTTDELHDVLRVVGDLSSVELVARVEGPDGEAMLNELRESKRAISVRIGAEERWICAEDAARYRDALGIALPLGLPAAFTTPVLRPLEELIARFARTHGPFLMRQLLERWPTTADRVLAALEALEQTDRIVRGDFRPDGREREWCDAEVLRVLRRRSLAALRREVEPVDGAALARFLLSWHLLDHPRRGNDALLDVFGMLQGASMVASSLDRDVFARRIQGYRPADLDEMCTSGEVVWIGAGALGANDGRLRLFFRESVHLLAPPATTEGFDGLVHQALLETLRRSGACFWAQLSAATPSSTETELLAALWDLVWAGLVTNDSIAPLRARVAGKVSRSSGARGRNRPNPGRLTRLGPPAAAGRWSLVDLLREPAPAPTAVATAKAMQLLERHGVVTREAVLAEGTEGGYASVYPVLKVLEERGQVRRGYFVAGLGAAQFALPGAVDRLRSVREADADAPIVVLGATDPAQPYGGALAWPDSEQRVTRAPTAVVLLHNGDPVAWLDRSSHSLVTWAAADDAPWCDRLAALVKDGEARGLEISKIDGEPARQSKWHEALLTAGFVDGYRGLVLRT
jgi:ATP-dependent Lhr-like helicase